MELIHLSALSVHVGTVCGLLAVLVRVREDARRFWPRLTRSMTLPVPVRRCGANEPT